VKKKRPREVSKAEKKLLEKSEGLVLTLMKGEIPSNVQGE
jgi:hypothetical protein